MFVEFEGKSFPAPTYPEKFLKIHYSDFMTLPPETERWKYIDEGIEDVDFGRYPSLINYIEENRRLEEKK